MKHLAKRLINILRKINSLEDQAIAQNQRIAQLESKENLSIHSMEVAQQQKVESNELRRGALSDEDLRIDLEKQYGTTNWAMKLIKRILARREFRSF